MNDEHDNAFEQRLRNLLAKTEDITVPELSEERLRKLRLLIPRRESTTPYLSLAWRKLAECIHENLAIVKIVGLNPITGVTPAMRNGNGIDNVIEAVSLSLPHGEIVVQVTPSGERKAKALLSVKGRYSGKSDLSVELLRDGRLIEARPLEQKAELTLDGESNFTLILYAGDEAVAKMDLDIGETKDSGHGG